MKRRSFLKTDKTNGHQGRHLPSSRTCAGEREFLAGRTGLLRQPAADSWETGQQRGRVPVHGVPAAMAAAVVTLVHPGM